MRATYLVFGQPHLQQAEIDEVVDTLRSGWIGTGPKAAELERRFAEYCEVPFAIGVSSCTAGLHLSLLALGAGPGTAVITTTLTFAATVNAILHTGARPLLVDVERDSMNLSPQALTELVARECESDGHGGLRHRASGARVIAILPVHFAGRPCAMDEIEALAGKYDLRIIEDAAHAIEARYRGRKIGSIGDLACFSFYATKSLTTGEGGMITTRSAELAQRLRTMSLHGLSRDAWARRGDAAHAHYQVLAPGYKYNLTDIAAALGLPQVARLEGALQRRAEIWRRYDEALADLPITLPAPPEPDTLHARHLYTVLVDRERAGIDRDQLRARLHEQNIGTGIHFTALHLQDFLRLRYAYDPEHYPNATYISERTLSLPMTAHLSDEDAADVIAAVRAALR